MKVTVIDYGLCNLLSVCNALKHVGANPEIVSDPDKVLHAERLVLPGVGAFQNGMDGLRANGMVDAVKSYAALGRPLLGICLGMEFLMDKSFEFGEHDGLGIIPGQVENLKQQASVGQAGLKVPHIGWNYLAPSDHSWDKTILAGLDKGVDMYFVHSFHVVPRHRADCLAMTSYGTHAFCSVVARGSVYGCQFHPEKSGVSGLKILDNFVRLP